MSKKKCSMCGGEKRSYQQYCRSCVMLSRGFNPETGKMIGGE
jgi:hypothetical protein